MSGPTFVIAGAARSGTTGLVEGLRTHPQVFVTTPKEPHYFAFHRGGAQFKGPGDAHTVNRVAVTARDAYLALYPQCHDYLALGDASVSTLYYHDDAIPELLALNPRMKVIVLLREPVARAYSAHQYMRARGLEPVDDFLEAVALEDERRDAGWHHIWHYTAMSRYAGAVEALQHALPPDQVGVWFFDDLERDFEGTVSQVLRFLGLPRVPGEASRVPRVNVSGQPKLAGAHAMIGWATAHEGVRTALKRSTSYRFRERIRGHLLLRSSDLPPGVRQALDPLFAGELEQLRELVPGPVPDWLRNTSR